MYSLIQSFSLRAYLFFWAFWVVWCQTVGHWSGVDIFGFHFSGYALMSSIVFDVLAVSIFFQFFWQRKAHSVETREFKSSVMDFPLFVKVVTGALFTVLVFTLIFQVPFDWDGLDYHLPAWVESLHRGFIARSDNPYFAARNYPKISSALFGWWIVHFQNSIVMRGVLILGFVHWAAAFRATTLFFGKNKWVILFWIAFPLALKESTTFYADLAGLSTFLCFLYFSRRREWFFAALALALFGSMKFAHLPVALVAWGLVHLFGFVKDKGAHVIIDRIRGMIVSILLFFVFASIQPLENFKAEGKFFGPLKCVVLGHDYCDGTLDPHALVVAPTLPQYQASDSFFKKMTTGLLPRQWVPSSDVDSGGYGWSFAIAWILGLLFIATLRKSVLPEGVLSLLAIAVIADSVIGANWYLRFHMILGWALSMSAALICQSFDIQKPWFWTKPIKTLLLVSLSVQILWLTPQRIWFLGATKETSFQTTFENLKSLTAFGVPRHATNPADVRSLEFFKMHDQQISVCGFDARPSLPLYGLKLRNHVTWYAPHMTTTFDGKRFEACPYTKSTELSFEDTRIYIQSKTK